MDDENLDGTPVVREKASHRKGRTSNIVRVPRVPTQERSKKRYQAILDATEEMLACSNIEDISLHDIGKATSLPPASVHYLFNTVAAIYMELNKVYNERLTESLICKVRDLSVGYIGSWQEFVKLSMALTRDEYNSNRAMSEVMLGPALHRSIRAVSLDTNVTYADASVSLFKEIFVVPEIPNMTTYFTFSSELSEGLWAGAYARYGKIDDVTFEESVRACVAYLRCFFPETMARRTEGLE